MKALSNLISLVSNFIDLIINGIQAIFDFATLAFGYVQTFIGFIPAQFTALFLIVLIAALIYLILGR